MRGFPENAYEEGFMPKSGKYVSRGNALQIAIDNNQLNPAYVSLEVSYVHI